MKGLLWKILRELFILSYLSFFDKKIWLFAREDLNGVKPIFKKYNTIVNNNIDVLVDPIYKIEYKFGQYKASLTGYAGYYVNSRTIYEDMEQLRLYSHDDIEKYLILHQPEVLKYMNSKGDVVNIYQGKIDSKDEESNSKTDLKEEKHVENVTIAKDKNKTNNKKKR